MQPVTPLYRGREVVVVGGGNSALQESLFIARFAHHVTLLVRGDALGGTQVLREQIWNLPNVDFLFNTTLDEIRGDNQKVTGLKITNASGQTDIRAEAVFVFVGLLANTHEFATALKLDANGFIVTDKQYCTSLAGVYAAGDARSGSTWQIASAVGEGVEAALSLRSHLMKQDVARTKQAAKKPAVKARPKAKSTQTV